MYSFPYLETVCCSMSRSNCCILIYINISQEAGKVVWYSHLFQNFPQFAVIHRVKGISIVNETEVDVFLKFPCFFCNPTNIGNLVFVSSAFSKSSLNIWRFMYCWSLTWRILSIILLAWSWVQLCSSLSILWHCPSLGSDYELLIAKFKLKESKKNH